MCGLTCACSGGELSGVRLVGVSIQRVECLASISIRSLSCWSCDQCVVLLVVCGVIDDQLTFFCDSGVS